MKKIVFILCLILVISCQKSKEQHPNYVEISGLIENSKSKEVTFYGRGTSKVISLDEKGFFKDTLIVKEGKYQLMLNEDMKMSQIYLKNGYNTSLSVNVDNFDETLNYENDGADYNNYLNNKKRVLRSEVGFKDLWYRDSEEIFKEKTAQLLNKLNAVLHSYKNIDEKKVLLEEKYNEKYIERIVSKFIEEHKFAMKLEKGTVSPLFEDYVNYDGSKTSLSDFKGKYIFIDVWATWCAPCKTQIPFLEELEKEYHDKNIVFVSMSVDKQKDLEKWKTMVKEKEMSGIQIIAPNATSSAFTRAYNINSIPRFILIDPEGKIIDYDAPRPSDKENVKKLLSVVNSSN